MRYCGTPFRSDLFKERRKAMNCPLFGLTRFRIVDYRTDPFRPFQGVERVELGVDLGVRQFPILLS